VILCDLFDLLPVGAILIAVGLSPLVRRPAGSF